MKSGLISLVQVQRFEPMNTSECVAEEIRKRIGVRQPEHRPALGTNEMSRCEKELSAQSLQGGALKARGRAQPLEPREQVVRQQDELKEHLGAAEVLHRNLVERIGGLELADNEFGPGAIVVEAPHRERRPAQIGDEHLIRVAFHLEEVQLRGGLLRHWAPDDHEPCGTLPPLGQ